MKKYISNYIKNNTKTIFFEFTKPQKKVIRQLIYQIFLTGSGLLRELGDTKKNIPKSLAEKFSYHLGKINLESKIEDFADRRILKFLKKNSVIAYDLSDISKEFSTKIEKMGFVFDGSKRKKSKGFFLHGVGFGKFLFRLKMHDGSTKFLPQVRKEILEEIIKITKLKYPIFAFDRGNDSNSFFEFLLEKFVKFIVRIKGNRQVILEKTGEIFNVSELKPGKYIVLIPTENSKQKKIKKYNRFLLIIKKDRKFKTPIRLLCSMNLVKFNIKKIVNFYLERWGVENSFKQIKTGLNLEKIRVLKFKKFKNLVSLMHFCSLLNEILFLKTRKTLGNFLNRDIEKIYIEYQKFKKRLYRTSNSHSFLIFLRSIFPKYCVYRKSYKIQLQTSLFNF